MKEERIVAVRGALGAPGYQIHDARVWALGSDWTMGGIIDDWELDEVEARYIDPWHPDWERWADVAADIGRQCAYNDIPFGVVGVWVCQRKKNRHAYSSGTIRFGVDP